MPAPRLPWIKFWPEAVDHAKFAELTDRERWTWVEVWAKASQQPVRWQFASVAHAVKVTGRKEADIRRLVQAGLIDECEDSIRIHNARKWQDRFPSDEPSNTPPTPGEHSANGHARLPETSDKKKRKKREEEEEKDVLPVPSGQAPRGNPRVAALKAALNERGIVLEWEARDYSAVKKSTAEPDLIAEAYQAVATGDYGDDFMRRRLSVHEAISWVNGYVASREKQAPYEVVVVDEQHEDEERAMKREWTKCIGCGYGPGYMVLLEQGPTCRGCRDRARGTGAA